MVVSFDRISRVGNNCIADMFFDKIRVGTVQSTPKEFDEFYNALVKGGLSVYIEPRMGTDAPTKT